MDDTRVGLRGLRGGASRAGGRLGGVSSKTGAACVCTVSGGKRGQTAPRGAAGGGKGSRRGPGAASGDADREP